MKIELEVSCNRELNILKTALTWYYQASTCGPDESNPKVQKKITKLLKEYHRDATLTKGLLEQIKAHKKRLTKSLPRVIDKVPVPNKYYPKSKL